MGAKRDMPKKPPACCGLCGQEAYTVGYHGEWLCLSCVEQRRSERKEKGA